MIRTGRYKYIFTVGQQEQLYDLQVDPDETVNLALSGDSETRELIDTLKERIHEGWEYPEPGSYKCRCVY